MDRGGGTDDYLAGLPGDVAGRVRAANAPGLTALRAYLASGDAVAFLGAGVSAPLYPMWTPLIRELVEVAVTRGLSDDAARTCRARAATQPDAVVEILRRQLGVAGFRAVLREVFRVRRDPTSGRTWTPIHELVCRMPFAGIVTTNYDPGIVDARIRVRSDVASTGFSSWTDELGLDDWITGDALTRDELPVLYAHGYHGRPDEIVLATTEYRTAYAGKLADALSTLAEIDYGAELILYPTVGGDHSALGRLLAPLADPRYPPVSNAPRVLPSPADTPAAAELAAPQPLPVTWVPEVEEISAFVGRVEELGRLDLWTADPNVRLIGVSAWGGAGKTSLVAKWLRRGGAGARPSLRGVFGWSFLADPSVESWIEGLLDWARARLGVRIDSRGAVPIRPADAVMALLRACPVVLVLDGLEVVQEGPAGNEFGRLLDGALRELLIGACRAEHAGLVVLTSRFPFADLEQFDGRASGMLELSPLTPAEGSAVLARSGAGWLPEQQRQELVGAVDGHALAVSALGGVLADRVGVDVAALHEELLTAGRTDARVARVLQFYADQLAEPDRLLVGAVGLFARPVSPETVLTVASHEVFAGRLAGWTPDQVRQAVHGRLSGLLSWHPTATVSAHPLVRDAFRPLAMGAAQLAAHAALGEVPERIASREDGLRLVEVIELLLDADQWQAADHLYSARTDTGRLWRSMPAVRLGQRAASAFVGTPARRAACPEQLTPRDLGFYLNEVGLHGLNAGDLAIAQEYLHASANHGRAAGDDLNLAITLGNLTDCHVWAGRLVEAQAAAAEAVTVAQQAQDRNQERNVSVYLGWVPDLAGSSDKAEQQFLAADCIEHADDPDDDHLFSMRGLRWGDFLARTGRLGPSRRLTDRNRVISTDNRWNNDVARCDRLLAILDLAAAADPAEREAFIRRGRHDADAALRLTRRRGLAWQELAALDAHARLDQVEQRHEWADHAAALRARLVPADLDPDPLATVERLVAADQASNDT